MNIEFLNGLWRVWGPRFSCAGPVRETTVRFYERHCA